MVGTSTSCIVSRIFSSSQRNTRKICHIEFFDSEESSLYFVKHACFLH